MSSTGTHRRPDILVVEDNPDDVYLLEHAFGDVDVPHTLHVVGDGTEALEFLRREGRHVGAPHPALVLLDLNVPGKDGLQVLREAKRDPRLRRVPYVVLTTSSAVSDLMLSYDLHVNAYLIKPVDLDDWLDLVRGLAHFWLRLNVRPPAGA